MTDIANIQKNNTNKKRVLSLQKRVMNKETARCYDILLSELCKSPKAPYKISHILQISSKLNFTKEDTDMAVSTFVNDGFLLVLEPFDKSYNNHFQLYNVSPKAVVFITHKGGYIKKVQKDKYKNDNIKFTWYRHWLWFIGFVLSFLLNLYLLFFKNE